MKPPSEELAAIKREAAAYYAGIKRVRVPYFGEDVLFTAAGFEHLWLKRRGEVRPENQQRVRFQMIRKVTEILKRSGTVQEYADKMIVFRQKNRGKYSHAVVPAKYFVFTAIIDDVRLSVVVRQVDNQELHFFSVYPDWKKGFDGHGNAKKVFLKNDENLV